MAVLSIEAAELQLDCLHRLLARLCGNAAGVRLLCRLPWAHNMLVRWLARGGWAGLKVSGRNAAKRLECTPPLAVHSPVLA